MENEYYLSIKKISESPYIQDLNSDSPNPIQPFNPENAEELNKELKQNLQTESNLQKKQPKEKLKLFMSNFFGENNIFTNFFKPLAKKNKFYNFSELTNYDNDYKEKCIKLFCQNRLENIEHYYNIIKKIIFSKCNEIYYDLVYLKPNEINDYKSKVSLSVTFCATIRETLEINNYSNQFKKLDKNIKEYILYDDEISDIANVIIEEIKEYGYDSNYCAKEKCFYIYYKYHNIDEEIKKNISKNIANFRKRSREE
jgi:hypothetical protein